MKYRFMILLSALLALPFTLSAANDVTVSALMKNAPESSAYPQAGALILLDELQIEQQSDGSVIKEGHRLVKIFQDRARDRMSDQKIRFNGETQRCVVLRAKTHLLSGATQEPEKDGIMEVSDPEAARAPFYSSARLKVVSFPSVELGCVLELKYRIEPLSEAEEADDQGFVSGDRLFGGSEPRLRQELRLKVQPGHEIRFELLNSDVKPEILRTEDGTTYHWVFENEPQIIPEFATVPMGSLAPRLVFTDAADFKAVGIWVAQRLASAGKPESSVVAEALKLTAGIEDENARIDALAYFLIKEIRNVRLPLGRVGWDASEPATILSNAYADIRDKYVLFAALSESLGIEVDPVLVHVDHTPLADPPALDQFDTILARVRLSNGNERFVSLTDQYLRFPELPSKVINRPALLVAHEGGTVIDTPSTTRNTCAAAWTLALDQEGNLKGKLSLNYDGRYDEQLRSLLYRKNDEEKRIFMQNVVDFIKKGAHLEKYVVSSATDLKTPMELELNFSVPNYAVRQGSVLIVNLPKDWTPLTSGVFSPVLPAVKYPVLIPTTATETVNVSFKLPQGFSIAYLPPTMKATRPELDFVFTTVEQPGAFEMNSTSTWHEGVVAPGDYVALWETVGATRSPARKLVLLKK